MKKLYTVLLAIAVLGTYPIFSQGYLHEVVPQGGSECNIQYGEAINCVNSIESLNFELYEPMGSNLNNRPLLVFAHRGTFQTEIPTCSSVELTREKSGSLNRVIPTLEVANIIQDDMVIQQGKPFKVWGSSAEEKDTVKVIASWLKKPQYAYADRDGKWQASLKVPKAKPGDANPHELQIINKSDTIEYKNILIGDVWFCAGQSNMDMKIGPVSGWYHGILNHEEMIENADDYSSIRVYTENSSFKVIPQVKDGGGKWQISSPESVGRFSAVAYSFGRELYNELNIPIGLVVVAEAGASCSAFIPKEVLTKDSLFNKIYWEPYISDVTIQSKVDTTGFFTKVTKPTLIYNGMVHPLGNLSIKGFIWYQGESNYDQADKYADLCNAMIRSWRDNFKQGELPFYYVQIAPFARNPNKDPIMLPLFWEAQTKLQQVKNTGMVSTLDVGDSVNVHPKNKIPVGERLAKIALNKTYGLKNVVYSGPVFKKFKVRGDVVKIDFNKTTVNKGLMTNDGEAPRYFTLAGSDQKFYSAKAKIVGKQVWLQSDRVPNPVAVRYGFESSVVTNLQNREGLPAMSFRTDNWQ